MCSSIVAFFRKNKNAVREYYDADEFAYEICSWVKRAPCSDLKVHQTLDSFGMSLVYKSIDEVRTAGCNDMQLYCENMEDVPDQGLVVELNIYRRRAIRATMAGPWMLSERICASHSDILKTNKWNP